MEPQCLRSLRFRAAPSPFEPNDFPGAQGKQLEAMKGEAMAAKEAGFLLQQLQDSSAKAMSTILQGTAPRSLSVRRPNRSHARHIIGIRIQL